MAKTECQHLIIIKGTTPSYELEFTEDEVAIDITGWTIYFTVKENITDSDANAKINKKITSHTDAENGKSLITLTKIETNLEGTYHYSLDYKDDEDNERTG